MSERAWARVVFAVGALAGLVLAIGSILERVDPPGIPAGAVATVDGVPISVEELARALDAVAADRRTPVEEEVVLDRLVDEELLVQRAIELGLDRHDRGVRRRLVEGMLEAILAGSRSDPPTRAEVEAFYRDDAAFFSRADRLRVRALRVIGENGSENRARLASIRLRNGEAFDVVNAELGDPLPIPVPPSLLLLTELREYLGPTVAARAAELGVGEVSDPIPSGGSTWVVEVVRRRTGEPPPLAAIEDEVRAEMRRRRNDRLVREYLDDLRSRAEIRKR